MFATIKGHYEQGKIFLDEKAPVESKADVIITFLVENDYSSIPKFSRLPGALKGKVAIPDDFNDPIEDLKDYL